MLLKGMIETFQNKQNVQGLNLALQPSQPMLNPQQPFGPNQFAIQPKMNAEVVQEPPANQIKQEERNSIEIKSGEINDKQVIRAFNDGTGHSDRKVAAGKENEIPESDLATKIKQETQKMMQQKVAPMMKVKEKTPAKAVETETVTKVEIVVSDSSTPVPDSDRQKGRFYCDFCSCHYCRNFNLIKHLQHVHEMPEEDARKHTNRFVRKTNVFSNTMTCREYFRFNKDKSRKAQLQTDAIKTVTIWTDEEWNEVQKGHKIHGTDWGKLSELCCPTKTPAQIKGRVDNYNYRYRAGRSRPLKRKSIVLNYWTEEEYKILEKGILTFGYINAQKLADLLPNRTPLQVKSKVDLELKNAKIARYEKPSILQIAITEH